MRPCACTPVYSGEPESDPGCEHEDRGPGDYAERDDPPAQDFGAIEGGISHTHSDRKSFVIQPEARLFRVKRLCQRRDNERRAQQVAADGSDEHKKARDA